MDFQEKYKNFLRAVSINKTGRIGVILTTSSFITFILLELLRVIGLFTNSYAGLITYLSLPLLFVVGLILIPVGFYRYKKETGLTYREIINYRINKDDLKERFSGARVYNIILLFTVINIIFLVGVSFRTMKFMDGPKFCGTACHTVMNPEWVTYQDSPHAHVKCVQCHVGEGVGAVIDSKLNGAWQMISASLKLYEKPIPTPVHNLRPARETCEKCHWPDKFYGRRMKSIIRYDMDKNNTPKYTTLNLKIDSGKRVGEGGIHWHTSKDYSVTYSSANDKREEIIWVEVTDKTGKTKRFNNTSIDNLEKDFDEIRKMDCVDCHNRATHIYETPEYAIDEELRSGNISPKLPFIKREGLSAITKGYATKEVASRIIEQHVTGFYRKNFPNELMSLGNEIDEAVKALQAIYAKNIHIEMNIDWNTYPNHLGHFKDGGCFRCHNNNFKTDEGEVIKYDCTTCHSILAYDSESPFSVLQPIKSGDKDSLSYEFLKSEFYNSIK